MVACVEGKTLDEDGFGVLFLEAVDEGACPALAGLILDSASRNRKWGRGDARVR